MSRTGDQGVDRFLIRHRRPSLWRLAVPSSLALVVGMLMIQSTGLPSDEWSTFVVLVAVAILAPFLLFGLTSRRAPDQWIEIRARSLLLPTSALSRVPVEVPLAEIRSIYARLREDGTVWIETSVRSFTFPIRVFESREHAALLVESVRRRIRDLPEGERKIESIDRDARIAERALTTRYPATVGAIVLLVLAAMLLEFGGGLERPFGVVRFGANVGFLVKEGELYRLVASSFLHEGLIHLGSVVFGIAACGAVVERLLGTAGALLIMLVAGLSGALALLVGGELMTLGASPIMYGLMGAAAFTTHQHRGRIPMLLRPSIGMWILIGAFTLPAAVIPEVDFGANMGGLLGGVVVGAILAGSPAGVPPPPGRPRWALVGAILLGGVYLAGLTAAVIAYRGHDADTDVRVIQRYLDDDRDTYVGLNRLAWMVAADPSATDPELELARVAAERAVERSPDAQVAHVEDTLATVEYRLGRYEEAVTLEKKVFAAEEDVVIASQLARFMRARADGGTGIPSVSAEAADGVISVESALDHPAAVYAVVVEGPKIHGLVTFPLHGGSARTEHRLEDASWVDGRKLLVVGVYEGESVNVAAYPMDERVAELP